MGCMDEAKCRDCIHFFAWKRSEDLFGRHADGVCTAPRPLLGQAPNREVSGKWGKGCQAFKAKRVK